MLDPELAKECWCWWYRKYAPGDTVLEGLDQDAREAKKGLWADSHPGHRGSDGEGSNDSGGRTARGIPRTLTV